MYAYKTLVAQFPQRIKSIHIVGIFFILLYTVHRPNPHLDSTFVGFLPIVSSLVFSSLLACLESIVSSSLF